MALKPSAMAIPVSDLKLTFNFPSLFFASPPGCAKFTIGTLIAASFHAHNFATILLKLALAGKDLGFESTLLTV